MVISPEDLENEALRIFEHLRIPLGGQLTQSALVKEWTDARLRYADLLETLKRLIHRNLLRRSMTPDDAQLQLTERGFLRMTELRRHHLRNRLRRLRVQILLGLMRLNSTPDACRSDNG